jgi:hypothetical protein
MYEQRRKENEQELAKLSGPQLDLGLLRRRCNKVKYFPSGCDKI